MNKKPICVTKRQKPKYLYKFKTKHLRGNITVYVKMFLYINYFETNLLKTLNLAFK